VQGAGGPGSNQIEMWNRYLEGIALFIDEAVMPRHATNWALQDGAALIAIYGTWLKGWLLSNYSLTINLLDPAIAMVYLPIAGQQLYAAITYIVDLDGVGKNKAAIGRVGLFFEIAGCDDNFNIHGVDVMVSMSRWQPHQRTTGHRVVALVYRLGG